MEDNTGLLVVSSVLIAVGAFVIIRFIKGKNRTKEEGNVNITRNENNNETHSPIKDNLTSPGESFDKTTPAKECFIKNLSLFVPLLNSLRSNMDIQGWKEAIISTQNDQLMQYWINIREKASAWETILQMWGLKCDTCTSFIGIEAYKEMYKQKDGSDIELGIKYRVIQPCWVLTFSDNDKIVKTVVSHGIVIKE